VAGIPRRRFDMAAVSYGAMDPLTGPGLAPLPAAAAPDPDRSAEPAGFVVATDDAVRIHFLDWGDGPGVAPGGPDVAPGGPDDAPGGPDDAPGVLLVHGLASTAWSWAPVARRLRGVARVMAMDLRGHGLSDAPTGGYEPDTLAADAIAVAEGAGLLALPGDPRAAPFVVAGIGYGAIVAAWTARALGDRCGGLVLVDGGWEDLAASTGATAEEWLSAIEEPPEVLASMEAWLADRRAFDPATWDRDEERAARAQVVETAAGRVKLAVHPHALAGSVRAMWLYDPAAVLPAVEARIAVLVARDDDGSRVAALADVAKARRETGRRAVNWASYPGRGHNLVRHEPRAVAAAVLATASGSTMRA
jgi:pimeloyl-ACP methyl ester carboxylesterase